MARFGTLRSRFALILGASTLLVLPGPGAGAAVVRPAAGTGGDATWFERYNGPGSLDDDAAGLVVSPDASRVFVTGTSFGPAGSGDDYATFAYDALTGAKLWLSRYNGARTRYDYGNAIAISPDGATVFVTGASTESGQATSVTTVAYDAATGAQLWVSVSSHGKGSGEAVAVSPDGSSVFVTGQDYLNSDYVTIAYDGSTGAELWASTYNGPGSGTDEANAIGVSPDGSTVWVTG
ncbi:MAG TPA: PQQ-binding-like beta-propeller repeat protein, partial [Actinomycetota bacterium]